MSDFAKLVVDDKAMYVFHVDKIPKEILRLKALLGVAFLSATFEERQPFIDLELKLEEIKKKRKTLVKD